MAGGGLWPPVVSHQLHEVFWGRLVWWILLHAFAAHRGARIRSDLLGSARICSDLLGFARIRTFRSRAHPVQILPYDVQQESEGGCAQARTPAVVGLDAQGLGEQRDARPFGGHRVGEIQGLLHRSFPSQLPCAIRPLWWRFAMQWAIVWWPVPTQPPG